jgi:hypothetical protein
VNSGQSLGGTSRRRFRQLLQANGLTGTVVVMCLNAILAVSIGIRLKPDDPGYIVASGFVPVIIALLVAVIFLFIRSGWPEV